MTYKPSFESDDFRKQIFLTALESYILANKGSLHPEEATDFAAEVVNRFNERIEFNKSIKDAEREILQESIISEMSQLDK